MATLPTFVCCTCGKTFERAPHYIKKHGHPFCSRACAGINLRRRVALTCVACGRSYECPKSKASTSRYCSPECRATKRKEVTELTCPICQKMFSRDTSAIRAHRKKGQAVEYCSQKCVSESRKNRVKSHCETCGKQTERVSSNSRPISFCSRKCQDIWQAKHFAGENHPLWLGGWQSYYGPNWESQRRLARTRDGNKCQHCGKSEKKNGRRLDVHHLRPFREFGYIAGENDFHLQANHLSNLITLCQMCHKKAEFGKIALQPVLLSCHD